MTLPSKEVVKVAVRIAGGAVTVTGGAWRFVETRYVHQADEKSQRAIDSLNALRVRERDSIEHVRDDRRLIAILCSKNIDPIRSRTFSPYRKCRYAAVETK